ncbi:phosphoglucosamine mutase [Candidatus Tachikawaea gelatinosa]|uniref:Phosphoglucosamine mutase n=1 Tax=Candidatus Tachikawaea gelatinosa TaxID=1410383 RepID=A0A090BWM3_9ENTR|nr:phosphoglucosamine mutase [Candidatus Tachikawaea gelatinosa]BAP58856.1 phosphoglucosamine mutase [Candidatus Tachikawaea gelatinosa]
MNQHKYFGTDGIRGKVGSKPITPDFVLKLGWAAGKVLSRNGSKKIIIGKDTRISGYMLESALEAGLSAAGLSTNLTGPMPTPAIAYLTRIFCAEAGIVISASHNNFDDNGIKFFAADGTKLPDKIEKAIELEINKPLTCVSSIKLGRASRISDAAERYIKFCKSTFPNELNLNKLKIVVDCANGATYHIAPHVLRELGAEVIPISVCPNGININKMCGTNYLNFLKNRVILEKADVGLAYDGDGDRVIMIDHYGNKVNGDQIIYIITYEKLRQKMLVGGVIGTQMSNMALELSLKKLNVPFVRTQVGDRYILEKMKEKKWNLGAESSGHIILLDQTTTGDGIIAGLQVLTIMVRNKMSLYDLSNKIKLYPQALINFKISNNKNLINSHKIKKIIDQIKNKLQGNGRIVLRKSGTEPLLRIMIESPDKKKVNFLANYVEKIIKLN